MPTIVDTLVEPQYINLLRNMREIPTDLLSIEEIDTYSYYLANFVEVYEAYFTNPNQVITFESPEAQAIDDSSLVYRWDDKFKSLKVQVDKDFKATMQKAAGRSIFSDTVLEIGFMSEKLEFNGSQQCFGFRVTKSEPNKSVAIAFKLGMRKGVIQRAGNTKEFDLNSLKK